MSTETLTYTLRDNATKTVAEIDAAGRAFGEIAGHIGTEKSCTRGGTDFAVSAFDPYSTHTIYTTSTTLHPIAGGGPAYVLTEVKTVTYSDDERQARIARDQADDFADRLATSMYAGEGI